MNPLILLSLLCFTTVEIRPSSSHFVFELKVVAIVKVIGDCDTDTPVGNVLRLCEPVLRQFCLREGSAPQSRSTSDCPLGMNRTEIIAFTPNEVEDDLNTQPGLPDGPVIRTITSEKQWPVSRLPVVFPVISHNGSFCGVEVSQKSSLQSSNFAHMHAGNPGLHYM